MAIIWHEQEHPVERLTFWSAVRVFGEALLLMLLLAGLFVGTALVQP